MELQTITISGEKREMPKTVEIGETDFPVFKEEFEMVQREEMAELKDKLWGKVMEVGREFEKGLGHRMSPKQTDTLLKSIPDSLDKNMAFRGQLKWDSQQAKYKLYDELGMLLTGRTAGYPGQTPKSEEQAEKWAIKLAEDYIGCSTVSRTQEELYDCIDNRLEKRMGLKPEIPEKYDFSEKVIKTLLEVS